MAPSIIFRNNNPQHAVVALALPVDRQHAAHNGHPHHAHGAGHAHVEGAEVQRSQEKAEGASGARPKRGGVSGGYMEELNCE